MKTKKLTPRNSAPVQRENTATVSRDGNAGGNAGNAIISTIYDAILYHPFAGDDAE